MSMQVGMSFNVYEQSKDVRNEDDVYSFFTLSRFITTEQLKFSNTTGEFSRLMYYIQSAIKLIHTYIKTRVPEMFDDVTQTIGRKKCTEKKIVSDANEIIFNTLTSSYSTCVLVSNAWNHQTTVIDALKQGKYIVAFDALNGTENHQDGLPCGSIFAIYGRSFKKLSENDCLQPGTSMLASVLAIYGASTSILICPGKGAGVHNFILDSGIGEFILQSSNIKTPPRSRNYCVNEGIMSTLNPQLVEYLNKKKEPKLQGRLPANLICSGSALTDFATILRHGGIFFDPATYEEPFGKLSFLCQCLPMAFLLQEAGGVSYSEMRETLSMKPESKDYKLPFVAGSKEDVLEYLTYDIKADRRSN